MAEDAVASKNWIVGEIDIAKDEIKPDQETPKSDDDTIIASTSMLSHILKFSLYENRRHRKYLKFLGLTP